MEFKLFGSRLSSLIGKTPVFFSVLGIIAICYDLGFNQSEIVQKAINLIYYVAIISGIIWTFINYVSGSQRFFLKVILFDLLSIFFFFYVLIHKIPSLHFLSFYHTEQIDLLLYLAVILAFVREFSALKFSFTQIFLNPAQLFVLSFLSIILIGTFLLILPNATTESIGFIDALFTSTSAVCVTGLVVVDTGTDFTFFGQCILLALFQIGGLGIMTFASYFSYFFRGGASYSSQLILGNFTNSNKLGEVFSTLKKIILVTFSIEFFGAIFIYYSIQDNEIIANSFFDQIFFSVFHAVSAFCNAGFIFFPNSLETSYVAYNYGLHGSILVLFIIGGLGFPIVFNLLKYLSYLFRNRLIPKLFNFEKNQKVTPWVLNLNSRITLITTLLLLIIGSIIFFIFEYNHTLQGHSSFGKVLLSIFSAATPRSGGFNVVDTSALQFSTTMLIILLMWIGASPASTGGGIKTSTFAVATLNFWSLARGKNRIEIFRREVADITVRRAFAIISLSLVSIGFGVFLISYFDSDKDLLRIAFECFSAYCTVGLSLGISPELTAESKLVIITLMFTGRVSMLTLLIAFLKREKYKNYHYSKEELLIN